MTLERAYSNLDGRLKLFSILIGVLCLAGVGYFRLNSSFDGELTVIELLFVSAIWMLGCVWLWWQSHRWQTPVSLSTVIVFAVLLRLLSIGASPILEDDGYRFLWDGRQTVETGTPYVTAPADHFDDANLSDEWHDVIDSINHPEIGTVYGPSAQITFALAYMIAPGEFWGLQLVLIIFDLVLILLISSVTSARNLMLYAWSPFVLKEFAFSLHPDAAGALFLLLAWWCQQKRLWVFAGVSAAIAVGFKVFAVIAVPLILGIKLRAWISLVAAALVVSLPFGVFDAWFPDGLKAMGGDWFFNAPIYISAIGYLPLIWLKLLLGSLLIMYCCRLYWRSFKHELRTQPESNKTQFLRKLFGMNQIKNASLTEVRRHEKGIEAYKSEGSKFEDSKFQANKTNVTQIQYMFALLFICSPVFNAWYLVWLLVFATIKPTLWAWLASYVVLLAYFSGINMPNTNLDLYEQPLWLVWLEFGLIAAAMYFQPKLSKYFSNRFN